MVWEQTRNKWSGLIGRIILSPLQCRQKVYSLLSPCQNKWVWWICYPCGWVGKHTALGACDHYSLELGCDRFESVDILFPSPAPSFARCRHYCSCEWFNVGCCCRWGSMGAVVRRVGDGAGVEEVMGAVGFIPTARVAQLFGSIFAWLRYSVASQAQL